MQCTVNTDTTIPVDKVNRGETFVHAHPEMHGVVMTKVHPQGLAPAPLVACVVIASARSNFTTGDFVVMPPNQRVISVAPRSTPQFVALEG